MGTKQFNNYDDLITFTRASKGHALRPVSYGDELVTNGDFSSSDGWTLKSNTSISEGQLTIDTTSDSSWYSNAIRSDINIVAGKIYYYEVDIESQTPSDQLWIYIGGGSVTQDAISLQGTGVVTGVHIPTKSTSTFKVEDRHSTPSAHVINSISVKEVTFDQPDGTLTLFEHPNNIPRVEYDADGNRLGLLVEKQRINSLTYSDDPTQWATSTTTATKNLTGPDNISNSAWTLEDDGNTYELNSQNITIPADTNTHCISFFVKKDNNETRFPEFQVVMANSGNFYLKFNTKTGATYSRNNSVSGTHSVENYGDWWRVVITATNGGTSTNLDFKILPAVSTTLEDGSVSELTTGSIGFYGAQIELDASFPTSYIKTTGSTATRSADVASIDVDQFGYNQNEGTLVAEAETFSGASLSTSVRPYTLSSGNSQIGATFIYDNAVFDLSDSSASNGKHATAFKSGSMAIVNNAGTPRTSSASLDGDYSGAELIIGGYTSATNTLNGHIKSIKYYPRRLSNAQLQDITS